MDKIPVALQLYTVRDACEKDFEGTLQKVADMGYTGVELAGTYGKSAEEIKDMLDELNLPCVGSHTGDRELSEAVKFHTTLDCNYIGWPVFPGGLPKTEEELKAAIKKLNECGAAYKEKSLTLYYHNHSGEFEKINAKAILDWFYENTDPDLVKAQYDVCWIYHAGVDPAEYMKKYPKRCPLLHLKDIKADGTLTEIGEGEVDFESIFAVSEKAGVEWYIVEQDRWERPSIESARISLENLKKWGIA
ncbi:TIM barrel protein [Candidatus Poribacteria bacterium]|nr:TIM barrel protein [Candidatus Poribacteria bacterium]